MFLRNSSTRTRRATVVAAAMLSTALLAACAGEAAPPAGKEEVELEMMDITVAVSNAAIEHTPIYAALERGTFTENGLNVEIVALAAGPEIVNAVASGEADFGVIGGIPTMVTAAQGVPLKVIGIAHGDSTATTYTPFQGIVSGPDSGIGEGEIEELRGKKIGLILGSGSVPYVQTTLTNAGVPLEEVEFVNISPADALVALQQGDVDAVALFQPFPSRAPFELPGATVVVNGGEGWFDPGPLITLEETIDTNPEAVKRFLTSVAESQAWFRSNLDEAASIATNWFTGLDLEVAKVAVRNATYDMRLSQNLLTGWAETTVRFLNEQGTLDGTFDPSTMVAPEILRELVLDRPELFEDLADLPEEDLL